MLRLFSKYFVFIAFTFILTAATGQEATATIEDEFNKMIDKSGNYQDFKVVKRTDLNTFFRQVSDSLKDSNKKVFNMRFDKIIWIICWILHKRCHAREYSLGISN